MLVGVLITFLVVILVLYLINMLPLDGRAKQIARAIGLMSQGNVAAMAGAAGERNAHKVRRQRIKR